MNICLKDNEKRKKLLKKEYLPKIKIKEKKTSRNKRKEKEELSEDCGFADHNYGLTVDCKKQCLQKQFNLIGVGNCKWKRRRKIKMRLKYLSPKQGMEEEEPTKGCDLAILNYGSTVDCRKQCLQRQFNLADTINGKLKSGEK
jgi:hypothetical protein